MLVMHLSSSLPLGVFRPSLAVTDGHALQSVRISHDTSHSDLVAHHDVLLLRVPSGSPTSLHVLVVPHMSHFLVHDDISPLRLLPSLSLAS